MENIILLDNIPFSISPQVVPGIKPGQGGEYFERVAVLVDEARGIGRPRAVLRVSYVEDKGEDFVVVDGVKMASRVLRVNIGEAYRVFPFVATCGRELDCWADSLSDYLDRYAAESICRAVARSAVNAVRTQLLDQYGFKTVSQMNPGSLEDWPLVEQEGLFRLLGDSAAGIGVELSESYLMTPKMSVSGIFFPGETSFENCQLCPRENCPGRKAKYDSTLYARKYAKATGD